MRWLELAEDGKSVLVFCPCFSFSFRKSGPVHTPYPLRAGEGDGVMIRTLGPPFGGAFLSRTNRLAPNCFGAEASSANVSVVTKPSAPPSCQPGWRGFSRL